MLNENKIVEYIKIRMTGEGWHRVVMSKKNFTNCLSQETYLEYLICQITWKYQNWLIRHFVIKE